MRTKLVYVMEKEDIEVLRKAKGIINLLYNAEVEFDNNAVEQDLLNELVDIEDMCVDSIDLNSLDEDIDYEDEDDSDGDEDEPYAYCECCGNAIENEDDVHYAEDGSACCCASCVDELDEMWHDDEDDEEDED